MFHAFGGTIGRQEAIFGKNTEQPHYCHMIPGINKIIRQEDMFYLISPRSLSGVVGSRDMNEYPKNFFDTVDKAYKAFNASSQFNFQVLPGGHEFFIAPSVSFFKKYL